MRSHQKEFIEMILAKQVLRFGDFTLKSGRTSPYFFNAGLINDGGSLARLGACYAQAIVEAGIAFDMLFGPAYKGIPLAPAPGWPSRRGPAATCRSPTTARNTRRTAKAATSSARRSRARS